MRIAVALFGIPRASDQALPTLLNTALAEAGALGELRLFHHLFMQDRVRNPRSNEDTALDVSAYAPFAGFDGELEPAGHCLRRWPVEHLKAFGDYYSDGFRSVENLVHQLHSLWRVTQRLQAWQPDVVLFLRPDLVYHEPIPARWIRAARSSPALVVVPDWQWWGGLNDRLAVCGSTSYPSYGRRIECAARFCDSTQHALHAERLLRFALVEARLRVRTRPLRASRIRADGRVVDEGFDRRDTIGAWSNRRRHQLARLLPL
jgi:hypothetical protein